MKTRLIPVLVLLLLGADFTRAEDKQKTEAPPLTQEQLDKQFEELLSGVTLVGHYTLTGQKNGPGAKEEKYTISSVKKLNGEIFLFTTRIQYGNHDVELPLPLRVKWAGTTPMVTLDNVPVPGLGTFNARVLFFNNKYAGTWSASDHGGHLFGRIVRTKPEKDKEQDKEK